MLRFYNQGLYGEGLLSEKDLSIWNVSAAMKRLKARFDSQELGFFDCPDESGEEINTWAAERLTEKWTDQVVIGIGGSSLGARAILDSARPEELRGLRTHFAENLDPESVDRLFSSIDPKTTLLVVITKSGTTIETMSQFWIARELLVAAVGQEAAKDHIVAITDPKSGELRSMVEKEGWKDFSVPPNVGGRFSVLTAVGLVPLALAGYPIERLLKGARDVRDRFATSEAMAESWGVMAAEHLALATKGIDQIVMMTYGDRLKALVDWFCQLWGESLGKATNRHGDQVHVGITPIKAVGVIDQHSQVQLYMEGPKNKHIAFLEVARFDRDRRIPDSPIMPGLEHLQGKLLSEVFQAELDGTRGALQKEGRATSTWRFEEISPEPVGAFLFAWEMITAAAGELWEINAFDQPGVELGKKIAHGILGRPGYGEYSQGFTSSEAQRFSLLLP